MHSIRRFILRLPECLRLSRRFPVLFQRVAPPVSIQWLRSVMSNFRLALRQLIKNPVFAAVAILTLAPRIGANAAIQAAEVASGLEGRWCGKVQIPGRDFVLIVDLAHQANWSGSATLPGLNIKGA